jgi:hypothetical protein
MFTGIDHRIPNLSRYLVVLRGCHRHFPFRPGAVRSLALWQGGGVEVPSACLWCRSIPIAQQAILVAFAVDHRPCLCRQSDTESPV